MNAARYLQILFLWGVACKLVWVPAALYLRATRGLMPRQPARLQHAVLAPFRYLFSCGFFALFVGQVIGVAAAVSSFTAADGYQNVAAGVTGLLHTLMLCASAIV